MRYEKIITTDFNNGEGIGVSIFVTGCPLKCAGCQNEDIQDPNKGTLYTSDTLEYIDSLLKDSEVDKHLSILGGEPLAPYNLDEVLTLCSHVRNTYPNKKIWLWTGFNMDEITRDDNKVCILDYVDYIIDGRYVESLKYSKDEAKGKYRGSSNQNLIDVKEYLSNNKKLEDEYTNMSKRVRGFEFVSTENKKDAKRVGIVKEDYKLPVRATKTSAGYDFYAPYNFDLKPQEQLLIWTNIKAYMPQGEMLILDTTSGNGTKKGVILANTIGIVDSDYYNNEDNEGNIGICLKNTKQPFRILGTKNIKVPVWTEIQDEDGDPCQEYVLQSLLVPAISNMEEENTIHFKRGDKIAQGVFVEFKTADNCNSEDTRKGGFGSTDNKEEV